VIGSFSKKGLGMSDEDLEQLSKELQGGRAALAVLCPPEEVTETAAELGRLGGKTRSFEVSEEDLQTAHQAIQAAPEATAAATSAEPEAATSPTSTPRNESTTNA
jgi:hypothetical protein